MDKYCEHEKIYDNSKMEYYFFTWSVPNVSSINNLNANTVEYAMKNGYTYNGTLNVSKDKIRFSIVSTSPYLKCFVSMFIGSKTLLLSNSSNTPKRNYYSCRYNYCYDFVPLSSGDEAFQKLKQHPNNTLVLICRMIHRENDLSTRSVKTPVNTSTNSLYNLKTLAAAFRNSSESSSKENVLLRVGKETETVSKVVLCARSPVFAKMFQSDMRELRSNTVTVTDIKMPVLKVLVSFLYTGELPNVDFDFLFDLYYASDKYDVADLRQLCADLLLPQISMENVIRVWKFAYSHDDALLKSTAIASIATNFEKWFSTIEWKNLVNDEPEIAAEVLNFLDFFKRGLYIAFQLLKL
ncbi:Speckle-type POZ protein [Araneus ventricosus]|uniref:Speckle-type POZ protein n=1 Tax=Araneus ventricosus TaxID=182803 RepID=A0A4Y2PVD4_ARAVE|nr:Speckle-type POZ protein [Araneus ventricosus]